MNLYNRRKRNHDYYGPFIYHIILKKQNAAPEFSKIIGNVEIPLGQPGCPELSYSKMGFAIIKALHKFEESYPEFLKKQYSIMPDHLHLILQKRVRTTTHLEKYMRELKSMIAEAYASYRVKPLSEDEIFQDRFTDKLLYRNINLQDWINYVRQNPYRRAMIMQRPDFFQSRRDVMIDGQKYEAYGNLFLLSHPDKYSVRIHRCYTDEQVREIEEEAVSCSREGGVIVSAFISPVEKRIRRLSELGRGKFILIFHETFGERYKPARHDFELCSEGRLLILSLGMAKGTPLSYPIATKMNELAERVSATRFAD